MSIRCTLGHGTRPALELINRPNRDEGELWASAAKNHCARSSTVWLFLALICSQIITCRSLSVLNRDQPFVLSRENRLAWNLGLLRSSCGLRAAQLLLQRIELSDDGCSIMARKARSSRAEASSWWSQSSESVMFWAVLITHTPGLPVSKGSI